MNSYKEHFPTPSQKMPGTGHNMVAASHPLAVQAGLGALRDGGNAVERRAVAARKESEKTAEERRRLLYVANMQSAARIWISSNGNQRQVEELLAAWIPVDEQPDL